MPNRILKESICTSEEIDQLSPFQEIMFYRLIVNCDDYGRADARAKVLKSKLFPLRDVRVDQIETALNALASAKLVILYEVDGKPFLQMKTWGKHQQVRAKKSKYPAPEGYCEDEISNDGNGNHLLSNDSKCPRNPIQSESKSESNPIQGGETRAREEREDKAFDAFWAAYPRKSGDIKGAYMAWLDALRKGATPEEIMDALEWQTKEWLREGQPRFIPSPENWLTNKRYEETRREGAQSKPSFSEIGRRLGA